MSVIGRRREPRRVDVPELRRVAKRIRDEEKPDLAAAKSRLDEASRSGGQDEMALAALVFMRHRTKLKAEDRPDVARWAQGIESPEVADLFAQYVARPLHERAPDPELVDRWSASAEPLLRRLAVRTARMEVVDRLALDEDALVQEAVADVLREHAQEDEEEVVRFLREHEDAPMPLVRAAAAALSPEHALALTTGRLPPAKRAGKKKEPGKAAQERARRARERAEREKDRARRDLAEAEAALERARRRVEALDDG